MNNTYIRQIGLFFFFALPEETLAMEAATLAALEFNKSQKIKNNLESHSQLIHCCHKVLTKILRHHKKPSGSVFKNQNHITNAFEWSENVDRGPWREFRRTANTTELIAVIWSSILKNSDLDIANGLGVTEGTVRYRVGKGLLLLGSLNRF
jgi:hypothetical protein